MLSHKDMTDESVELMLSTLLAYEPSHESALFPISDTYDVTASLISVTAAIQDPKYHMYPN